MKLCNSPEMIVAFRSTSFIATNVVIRCCIVCSAFFHQISESIFCQSKKKMPNERQLMSLKYRRQKHLELHLQSHRPAICWRLNQGDQQDVHNYYIKQHLETIVWPYVMAMATLKSKVLLRRFIFVLIYATSSLARRPRDRCFREASKCVPKSA